MSSLPALRIAGVPEAFNDPFASADFNAFGLSNPPVFVSTPGGSGAMLNAVISGQVDAAFMLTDCIVAAIENGSPLRLAGPLVSTPLTWAIIVTPNSSANHLSDLSSARWGISRMGSGSHVMARLEASRRGWPEPTFVVCNNFTTLRARLTSGDIDVFLWEHFTTKPFADSGELRFIGGVPTPWPCFAVAVREDCSRGTEVRAAIDAFVIEGARFITSPNCPQAVAEKHGMTIEDARAWAAGVRYAASGVERLDDDVLRGVRTALCDAGVINLADGTDMDKGTGWYAAAFTKN